MAETGLHWQGEVEQIFWPQSNPDLQITFVSSDTGVEPVTVKSHAEALNALLSGGVINAPVGGRRPDLGQQLLTDQVSKLTPLQQWAVHLEQLATAIERLNTGDVTPDQFDAIVKIPTRVCTMLNGLEYAYLDGGGISTEVVPNLLNSIFNDGVVDFLRIEINLTDANNVDGSEQLGTAYKKVFLRILQAKFGATHVANEGSAFYVTRVPLDQVEAAMRNLPREVMDGIHIDGVDVAGLRDARTQAETPFPVEKLPGFAPRFVGVHIAAQNEPLREQLARVQSSDDAIDIGKRLETESVERVVSTLKEGAALCSLVGEVEPNEVGLREVNSMASGVKLYVQDGSVASTPYGRAKVDEAVATKRHYIPPFAKVDCADVEAAMAKGPHINPQRSGVLRAPRPRHELGQMRRARTEKDPTGGVYGELEDATAAFAKGDASGLTRIQIALRRLSNRFSEAVYKADRNPRDLDVYRWSQDMMVGGTKVVLFPFAAQVAKLPGNKVHLVTVEMDGLGAFLKAHGSETSKGEDVLFETVEPFREAAKRMGISTDRVSGEFKIANRAGDLFVIALPTVNSAGKPVDIGTFLNLARRIFRERFAVPGRYYQAERKVEGVDENGKRIVVRTPRWKLRSGKIVDSLTRPPHSKPLMVPLSFTGVGQTIRKPAGKPEKVHDVVEERASAMSTRIDALKGRKKGQVEVMNRPNVGEFVSGVLKGGLAFFVGETGSELILHPVRFFETFTPTKVIKNYGVLTAGGAPGKLLAKGVFSIPRVGRFIRSVPILNKIIGEGLPFFTAVSALEISETGEVNWSRVPFNFGNVMSSKMVVHGALVALGKISWLAKFARVARFYKIAAAGDVEVLLGLAAVGDPIATGIGIALSAIAEFTIMKIVDDLAAKSAEASRLDYVRLNMAKIIARDQELLRMISEGIDPEDLKDAFAMVEGEMMIYAKVVEEMRFYETRMIKEKYYTEKRDLKEWYDEACLRPLDGTWSRAELTERYEEALASLDEKMAEELRKAEPKDVQKFAHIPADPTKQIPSEYKKYFDPDQKIYADDMDESMFPSVSEVGYRQVVSSNSWDEMYAQFRQYQRDRTLAIAGIIMERDRAQYANATILDDVMVAVN